MYRIIKDTAAVVLRNYEFFVGAKNTFWGEDQNFDMFKRW